VYDPEQDWAGPEFHSLTALTSGALGALGDEGSGGF
jgi:hypothetical protein